MNKKNIRIKRIAQRTISLFDDDIAVEKTVDFKLPSGQEIKTTYSPGHLEEMILGRGVTSGELAYKTGIDGIHELKISDLLKMARLAIETPAELFNSTGCAHSCILASDNKVICHMEDIKRHNALDKAVGYAVKNKISLDSVILFTSGRVSLDYIEKAVNAGIRIIASRAAVTDAAIEFAITTDTTLLGFVREGRANIYHEGKVKLTQEE